MKIPLNIKFSTSWNQLSEKQLQEIAYAFEVFSRNIKKAESCIPEMRLKLQVELVKNILRPNNFLKVWIALRQIPPEEYNTHLEFLTSNIERTIFPKAFKVKRKWHYPPGDRLNNVTMKEFNMADTLFYQWKETQDIRYLNLLCAALYRPGPKSSPVDLRHDFYQETLNEDAKKFRKLNIKKKLAMAYAYAGCRNFIASRHPHIFPKPVKQENETPVKQKYEPFGKLISAKSDYKPYEIAKTENLNIYKFLGVFENELIEIKKQK